MDGMEAAKRIRELGGANSLVPIIALTANALSGAKDMFLQNGFNDFLPKPIDLIKLNAVLERWIPREKRKAPVKRIGVQRETADIAIEGVDVKLGLSRTGGTVSGYLQTLAIFRKDVAEKISEIRRCLEGGNLPLYVTYVHALKSATANIGAADLSETAKALEMAGRREDWEIIEERTPRLLANLELIMRDIDKVLAAEKEKRGKADIDTGALKGALGKLRMALDDIDPGLIGAAVKDLRPFEHAADWGGAVEGIMQYVLNGEYDEAVSLIESLLQEV
jgi:HPt (histidine-containing phosphotransfer) domain-containing protein